LELWIIIAVWLLCGIANLGVARSRGMRNVTSWFVMGTLLGPFGLILALMDARPPKSEYTMEALNQLGELRAQGALSNEEYEARRNELLGRL
jgi:Short C-terminal domain